MSALDDLRAKMEALSTGSGGLRAKLKAREGQPGYSANVAALESEIARQEALTFLFRDTETGQFVTAEYALAHPDTTRRVES